jgi:putative membrane protein
MSGFPTSEAATAVEPVPGAGGGPGAVPLPVTLRPERSLLTYYMLTALLFGPALVIAVFPFFFRFRTLHYDIDEEGITMRWGILFRREISLTYARIQDIRLSSNVVERWLGLARIELQTASGSSSAEMTIEGIRDVEAMRDFLYSRMRGATAGPEAPRAAPRHAATPAESADGLAATLEAVADELRAIRLALGSGSSGRIRSDGDA